MSRDDCGKNEGLSILQVRLCHMLPRICGPDRRSPAQVVCPAPLRNFAMTSAPCPNCGAAVRQNRADGRCVACGKPLPEGLRAPPDTAESLAKTVRLPAAVPAFASHYDRAFAHLKKGEYEPAIAEYTEA